MKIIKSSAYWHKYDQYVAYLHEYEDGALMLEYTLEFDTGAAPCYIKKRVKKIDERSFEFMCSLEEHLEQEAKRPKKTKSLCKSARAEDGI